MKHLSITVSLALALHLGCNVAGPPAFPENTTAALAGPRCDQTGQPCRCDSAEIGEPPEGYRRFELRLPYAPRTASAIVIEGVGAVVRDADNLDGSCFYIDLQRGATYRVRYLAQGEERNWGIAVAFDIREHGPEGWYDVLRQRCGSSGQSCQYTTVQEWTGAVEGGHRFHDPCGSSRLDGMRVDGGTYDRHFIDAQFSFNLVLRHSPPIGAPGTNCQRAPGNSGVDPETTEASTPSGDAGDPAATAAPAPADPEADPAEPTTNPTTDSEAGE